MDLPLRNWDQVLTTICQRWDEGDSALMALSRYQDMLGHVA